MPDLPVAAPDHARIEALREEAARGGLYQAEDGPVVRVPSWEEVTFLLDFADVLLAERQQDKQLLGEVDVLLDCLAECAAITGNTDWAGQARALAERIRAALAVEEDA